MLGIKLAEIFERKGKIIKFISLDGSPSLFQKYIKSALKDLRPSKENLERWLMYHMCFEILPNSSQSEVTSKLTAIAGTEQKLKTASRMVENKKYSDDFILKSFYGVLNRIISIVNEPEKPLDEKLNSKIVLIRSKVSIINDIGCGYDLELFTKSKIDIHLSTKSHFALLEDSMTLETIQKESSN